MRKFSKSLFPKNLCFLHLSHFKLLFKSIKKFLLTKFQPEYKHKNRLVYGIFTYCLVTSFPNVTHEWINGKFYFLSFCFVSFRSSSSSLFFSLVQLNAVSVLFKRMYSHLSYFFLFRWFAAGFSLVSVMSSLLQKLLKCERANKFYFHENFLLFFLLKFYTKEIVSREDIFFVWYNVCVCIMSCNI